MFGPFGFYEHELHEQDHREPSWTQQLDINGMQPHSREHYENEVNSARSFRKYDMIAGEMIDYAPGIHFGDTP